MIHAPAETNLAHRPAQADQHPALQQALEIDEQIIAGGAQLSDKGQHFPPGPQPFRTAAQGLHPPLPFGHQQPVKVRMPRDNVGRRLLDQPVNTGLGIMAAQAVERGQGMDDVADGACFDDQDMHGRKIAALSPLRGMNYEKIPAAPDSGKQFSPITDQGRGDNRKEDTGKRRREKEQQEKGWRK